MEENPFVFGKAAEGSFFTNRKKDAKHLEANLTHGINTILISPRRWGKTSLVKRVMANVTRPDIKIIYVDIFSCKSEYDFYRQLATNIIQQTSSRRIASTQSTKCDIKYGDVGGTFHYQMRNQFSIRWKPIGNI